jgi:hypothetical protein
MNQTNFEHALFAILMQAVFGLFLGEWWLGAAFGSAFFLGREHSQREYHITKTGNVGDLNPLSAFDFWNWSKDAKLDLIFPVVATCVVAALIPSTRSVLCLVNHLL